MTLSGIHVVQGGGSIMAAIAFLTERMMNTTSHYNDSMIAITKQSGRDVVFC